MNTGCGRIPFIYIVTFYPGTFNVTVSEVDCTTNPSLPLILVSLHFGFVASKALGAS